MTAASPVALAAADELVLLVRPDCDLCDEMLAALHACAARHALPALRLQDVDSDATLQRRYGLKIPVLLWQGSAVCRTRFDEAALLAALGRRGAAARAAHSDRL